MDGGWLRRRGRLEKDCPTKRRPICRLPRKLFAHLKRWRRMDEAQSIERIAQGLPPITTVLHHGGRPLNGRVRRSLAAAVKDAELKRRPTPHWLRHTAATWLVADPKVPLEEAAGFLGMTVDTLTEHYDHHRPDFPTKGGQSMGR